MPRIFFVLLLSFSFGISNIHAQQFLLNGKVTDHKNNPSELIQAILLKDSIRIQSAITDSTGKFSIKAPSGNYTLILEQLGKKLYTKAIHLDADKDLGKIQIDAAVLLQTIDVSARKKLIERKIDRLVFNVENSIVSQGGDGLDILRVSPNISVRDDQITMIGKSEMALMVNNRLLNISGEDLVSYLRSIKSEDISNVEIISNPSAKYDAQGNSGIININLKKSGRESWNASISSAYEQSKFAEFNNTVNASFFRKGLAVTTSLSHNDGLYYYRTEDHYSDYPDKLLHSLSKMKNDYGANLNANIGIDYDFTKKLSAGIQYISNKINTTTDEINDTKVNGVPNYLLQTLSDTRRDRQNKGLNMHSYYKINEHGTGITFNADYLNYRTDNSRTFSTKKYDNFTEYLPNENYDVQNGSNQHFENYAAQLDIDYKTGDLALLFGGKLSKTDNSSNISFYNLTSGTPILEENKSDLFDYSEDIQALYLSGEQKLGKYFQIKAGIRMEATTTDGYSHNTGLREKNQYTRFFPTLYLLYKANETHAINLNYGRRINRPNYIILNPFVRYINEFTTSEGNPFLKPYFTDNIELNYNYRDNWTSTLYLSSAKNVYDQVNYFTNTNINSATKYENVADEFSIGLTEIYSFQPIKNLESSNTANVYYRKVNSSLPQGPSELKKWSAYFETDNNYALNASKTFYISANYWYQLPEYSGIYDMKARHALDLAFKGIFLNKSLTATVYVSDLFRTLKINSKYIYEDIISTYTNYENRQSVRFSIRYAIGNHNFKSKSIRRSNEEEAGRAN